MMRKSRSRLLLDVTQDKPEVQHAQRRFVFPIFRFPVYRCLGWVGECQHRYGTHCSRETYHFDADCTVRLTSLCVHIPSPLAEVPELHRFSYLLRWKSVLQSLLMGDPPTVPSRKP